MLWKIPHLFDMPSERKTATVMRRLWTNCISRLWKKKVFISDTYDLIKMVLDLKNMINWAELRKKKGSSLILDGKRDSLASFFLLVSHCVSLAHGVFIKCWCLNLNYGTLSPIQDSHFETECPTTGLIPLGWLFSFNIWTM